MRSVGAYEAKTHLPRLLDEVAKGESIIITKHGVPVARLVPPEHTQSVNVREVIDSIRAFRKGRTLEDVSVQTLIDEGRRH